MTDRPDLTAAAEALEEALRAVPARLVPAPLRVQTQPLRSLLAECEALMGSVPSRPVRIVQHFACTGGTLMSRALAVQPNVALLSEIDPLSTIMVRPNRPAFAPTDLIHGVRHALRQVDEPVLVDMFLAALEVLHRHLTEQGLALVVRDHAHSQYCVPRDPAGRPSLREMVGNRMPILSVLTVRHPLDSFLSLVANGWHTGLEPATLDTYSQRYLIFLDANRAIPQFQYEAFIADPAVVVSQICAALELPVADGALSLMSLAHLSGGSGRSSGQISNRPRRDIPDWIGVEREQSEAYQRLCAELGYREG